MKSSGSMDSCILTRGQPPAAPKLNKLYRTNRNGNATATRVEKILHLSHMTFPGYRSNSKFTGNQKLGHTFGYSVTAKEIHKEA